VIADSPEARLVGCIMRDHGQIDRVAELVTAEDFNNPHLAVLYTGVVALAAQHVETNAMIVSGYLQEWSINPAAIDHNDLLRIEHQYVLNPWEATEYARMVRTAAVARGIQEAARYMLDPQELDPFEVAARAQQMLGDVLAGQQAGRFHPRPLGDILMDSYEHDWLVEGMLERKDRLVLTGHEGQGKSWLMRQIAICVAAGMHPFAWTRECEPRTVLAVDAENSEQQWARGTRYMVGRAESLGKRTPREHVIVQAGLRLDFTKPSEVAEVHRLVDRYEPDVLYIGPLYKLMPKEVTNDNDAAPLIVALDSFRERGLALLMEAHAGKGMELGGHRDMRPRGSSALLGWPEFGFGLRPLEDDPSMADLVRWRGDREARDWPTRIRRGVEGEMPWMPVWE
jgi:hypothetical protein